MVELAQDTGHLCEVTGEGWFVQARKPAGHENLPYLDIIEYRPQRVEAPLLRRLDQDRIAVEAGHEPPIALRLAMNSGYEITAHTKFMNTHAVIAVDLTIGIPAGGDGNLMPGGRH